jgi:hypothetical protein
MYTKPIELRVNKHPNGGYTYYTVDKVFPGVGNVAFGQRKFMTYKDVQNWARTEYDTVPVLHNY